MTGRNWTSSMMPYWRVESGVRRAWIHSERDEDVRQQDLLLQGTTSHPKPAAWKNLVAHFIRHTEQRYGKMRCAPGFSRCGNEPNLSGFLGGRGSEGL